MGTLVNTDTDPQRSEAASVNHLDRTSDLIRVGRKEKTHSLLWLSADDASLVGDNLVSPVEGQIRLYPHPIVTSKTLSLLHPS